MLHRHHGLPIFLLFGLLAACAGPSDSAGDSRARLEAQARDAGIVPETRPAQVSMRDHRAGVTIGLLNESRTDLASFYSEARQIPTYKVVPDLDMGALLAQLGEFGFFNRATPSDARVPGAQVTVQLERAGQVYTLAYTAEDPQKNREVVQNCSLAIQALYNAHQAYQVVENPHGEQYFDQESQRLESERLKQAGNKRN